MAATVECPICYQEFGVKTEISGIPNHDDPSGEPCEGSGKVGNPAEGFFIHVK